MELIKLLDYSMILFDYGAFDGEKTFKNEYQLVITIISPFYKPMTFLEKKQAFPMSKLYEISKNI